jgi:uncharacterized membrane protein
VKVKELVRGIAIGAAAMYLLDRARGKRRRAVLRDKATHLAHELEEAAGKTARDARNRSRGVVASAAARLKRDAADDAVLSERVRAAIGRVVAHPASVDVTAQDGQIRLTGDVLASELGRLIARVEAVRGVRNVIDHLRVHETAEGVSALQGGKPREPRFELRQQNWSPTARVVTGAGGTLLALYGRRLPAPVRQLTTLLGLGILTRAVTNLQSKRLLGVQAGRRAVVLQKTMEIDAPVEEVFDFWRRFENFPRFMAHLREVRRTGEWSSHWVARGPSGSLFHWNAEITDLEPNRLLAWRSIEGATIQNAGVVRFQPIGTNGTRIHIRLSYNPPAGALGHLLASLLGADPKHAMDEDLVRFKSLMEQGKASVHGQSVRRRDLFISGGQS